MFALTDNRFLREIIDGTDIPSQAISSNNIASIIEEASLESSDTRKYL
jgi:hypothetical protein